MRVPLSLRFAAFAFGFLTMNLSAIRMLAPAPIFAGETINQNQAGLTLKGYDPVAYFTEGKPVKGERQFQHKWMGATWQFSSAANRDLFVANPERSY